MEQARAGKLQEYRDFFERIKSAYPASWALGCRDLAVRAVGGGTVTVIGSVPGVYPETLRSIAPVR